KTAPAADRPPPSPRAATEAGAAAAPRPGSRPRRARRPDGSAPAERPAGRAPPARAARESQACRATQAGCARAAEVPQPAAARDSAPAHRTARIPWRRGRASIPAYTRAGDAAGHAGPRPAGRRCRRRTPSFAALLQVERIDEVVEGIGRAHLVADVDV